MVCAKIDRDWRNGRYITSGRISHEVGYKFDWNFISSTVEPGLAPVLLPAQGTLVFQGTGEFQGRVSSSRDAVGEKYSKYGSIMYMW